MSENKNEAKKLQMILHNCQLTPFAANRALHGGYAAQNAKVGYAVGVGAFCLRRINP